MAKVVIKKAVKREKGKLYFVAKNGDLMSATMNRRGGKRGRKSCKRK